MFFCYLLDLQILKNLIGAFTSFFLLNIFWLWVKKKTPNGDHRWRSGPFFLLPTGCFGHLSHSLLQKKQFYLSVHSTGGDVSLPGALLDSPPDPAKKTSVLHDSREAADERLPLQYDGVQGKLREVCLGGRVHVFLWWW